MEVGGRRPADAQANDWVARVVGYGTVAMIGISQVRRWRRRTERSRMEELLAAPVSDVEVALDDAGDYVVTDGMRGRVAEQVRTDLRNDWPEATDSQIDKAADEILPFHLHTLATGRMNYAEVRRLGATVADILHVR